MVKVAESAGDEVVCAVVLRAGSVHKAASSSTTGSLIFMAVPSRGEVAYKINYSIEICR
ncbi:hypothetical protein D9M70_627970 [compost metagenome]